MDTFKTNIIEQVAIQLMNKNGRTSTLEVKEELRATYPGRWYQSEISETMDDLVSQNGCPFTYDDNGQFREYYIPAPVKQENQSFFKRILNLFKK